MKKLLSYLLLSLGIANLYGSIGASASELKEQVEQTPAFPKAEEQLHVSEITAKNIERLKTIPHLNLKITGDRETGIYLNLDAMRLLGTLTNLESLDLGNQLIMKGGLKNLSGLKNLTRLNLNYTNTTDEEVADLVALTNLKDLRLANTQITDAGLVSVGKLKELELLYLFGTKVSDAGLQNLKDLKHLRNLMVSSKQVTPQAKENLFKHIRGQ